MKETTIIMTPKKRRAETIMRNGLVRAIVLLSCASLMMSSASQGKPRFRQGQNKKPQAEFINPKDLHPPGSYTHVVSVNQGKLVFVSGQVALNKEGAIVGKGDLRVQATQVFENLKTALAAAGASFSDVIKMNTYVVNCKPTDVAAIREIRNKYIAKERPPASTLVGVQALAREDFLIEIEVVATVNQ
jgi:enamine deaminase RidA (YjgF/YER057c/UK114 family)